MPNITLLSCSEFNNAQPSQETRLLDVRSELEWQDRHIPGAELMPLSLVHVVAEERILKKDTPIITYCMAGGRSLAAAEVLVSLGYTDVSVLEGGCDAWYQTKK
jgi:rhodanese-related sulfurtransferase